MSWHVVDKLKEGVADFTASEYRNLREFQRQINAGNDPKTAAAAVGDTDYKQLSAAANTWQIRLSQKMRLQFTVDDKAQEVVFKDVGHT